MGGGMPKATVEPLSPPRRPRVNPGAFLHVRPAPFGPRAARGRIAAMAPGTLATKVDRLHQLLGETGGAIVAYSGGTDSSLVAAVAARALGDRARGRDGRLALAAAG